MVFVPRETNELLEMIMQLASINVHGICRPSQNRLCISLSVGTCPLAPRSNYSRSSSTRITTHRTYTPWCYNPKRRRLAWTRPAASPLRGTHYIPRGPLPGARSEACEGHLRVSIFMLTNKFCDNPDAEDSKTILQQFSIQRYIDKITGEMEANAITVTAMPSLHSLFARRTDVTSCQDRNN